MTEEKQPKKQAFQLDLSYFIVAMFAGLFIRDLWVGKDHTKTIPYSVFRTLLDKGEVTDLVIGRARIVGPYTKSSDAGKQHFSTVGVEPQLADSAQELLARETLGADALAKLTAGLQQHRAARRELAAIQ